MPVGTVEAHQMTTTTIQRLTRSWERIDVILALPSFSF